MVSYADVLFDPQCFAEFCREIAGESGVTGLEAALGLALM
jgi:hypothetical protein